MVRNLPAIQKTRFDPWVGRIPWKRKWLPTPVFLPEKSQEQRATVYGVTKGQTQLSQ